MIFQGIRTSIAKKPYIFVIFQGGGSEIPVPHSGSAHEGVNGEHFMRIKHWLRVYNSGKCTKYETCAVAQVSYFAHFLHRFHILHISCTGFILCTFLALDSYFAHFLHRFHIVHISCTGFVFCTFLALVSYFAHFSH